MAKKRIYACWALLFVLLFLSGIIQAVGVAQARYQNTATASATIRSSEIAISSNCLVTERDVPRRVLLGQLDLDGSVSLPFWILSTGADATGKLNWGVENPDHAEYIDISVFAGFETLEPNAELNLLEDIQMDLLLCLEPTEKAQKTAHDRLQIKIHVTWGDAMWGTFLVELPEVKEQADSDLPDESAAGPSAEATEETTTGLFADATPDPTTAPTEEETTTAPTEEETTTAPTEEETTTAPIEEETTTAPTEEETTTAPTEEETTTAPTEEETTTAPIEEETTTAPIEEETTTAPIEEETTTAPTEEETTTAPTEEETTTAPTEEETTTAPTEEETTTAPTEEETTTAPSEEETTTEPSEEATTTESSEEATTTEPATDPTMEPSEDPTMEGPADSTTGPFVEATPDPTTDSSTTEPSANTTPDDDGTAAVEPQIRTLSAFYPGEQFPVLVELPKHISAIRLGVLTGKAGASSFEPFPDYTMFSLDGGASYYMLYGGYIPEFGLNQVTTVPFLVDFSYAQVGCGYVDSEGNAKFAIAMETYVDGALVNTYSQMMEIDAEHTNQMTFALRNQQNANEKLAGPILTFENTLEYAFPLGWRNANLEYSVEHLTMTEERLLQYVPVTLSKDGLDAVYLNTEEAHKLTLQLGEAFAEPGTYRVSMTWTYDNICFMEKQTTFFVNSSALMDGVMGSQEVPNDQ